MSEPIKETRQDLKSLQQDVRALRDEVKLKLHLAGMDIKSEWEKLEPQLDRAASSASIVTSEVMADLKKRLVELRKRIELH
jgi:transposase